MSALGDYVHYRPIKYAIHGTSLYGSFDRIGSYQTYVSQRLTGISDVSADTINILKQRLKKDSNSQIEKDKIEYEKDFQNKIDSLYDFLAKRATVAGLRSFNNNKNSSQVTSEKIKGLSQKEWKRKKQLVTQINTLLDRIAEDGAKGAATEKQLKEVVRLYHYLSGKKSSLKEIQDEIGLYQYYSSLSNIAGTFGEMLVAACDDKIEQITEETMTDILKSIEGNHRSEIDTNRRRQALQTYPAIEDEAKNIYKIISSEDKVDVNININEENVLASVKNTNTNRINVQKETSLLDALVKMNEAGNYANHWLNCHAGIRKYTRDGDIADSVLKFELAYNGLVGGNPLKNNAKQANIFVYMNRQKGEIMVKSTKKILMEDLDQFKITPNPAGMRFENRWEPHSYWERLQKIIIWIHQQNLRVSYKIGQL